MSGLSTPSNGLHGLNVVHVASSRFEAARLLASVPNDNKFARLHGHGFIVSAYAALPADWAFYPGGELPRLTETLHRQAKRLHYRSLNDLLAEPSDVNLAAWFGRELGIAGVTDIVVQSTLDQGVSVNWAGDDQADGHGSRHQVWRRYRFQAAHQLPHVPAGHKCGRMHGHGFQVLLCATADAASSGMAVDYDTLDRAWAPMAAQLSYQCLNQIPGLENPTSEILAAWIWQQIKPGLSNLSAVTVYETASCGATFNGDTYRIWKDFSIDSAIRYQHASVGDPRSALHGYTYTLRLHLSAPLDQVMGWTVDYGDVKAIFNPVFKSLDHHPLHEHPELAGVSQGDTASMAQCLFAKTQALLPPLVRLDLFETEGCGALVGADLQGPPLPLARVGETFEAPV